MATKRFLVLVLVCVAAVAIGGCGSSSTSSGPQAYTQDTLDSDTVWAVNTGMVSIYNNNLAGKPTGSQNMPNKNCALGGTVSITGTTTYDSIHGITTVDLTYALSNCRFTSASGSLSVTLTMNGTMTHSGFFSSSSKDEIFSSNGANVSIVGTAERTGYIDGTINENCTYYAQSKTSSVTGSICGRDVSWTY
ncbi:MAG: hypothetical protein OEW15_00920 [Nitrospirota bacterium]|nr:hypothetical protein [Nitrospirota bacterium]